MKHQYLFFAVLFMACAGKQSESSLNADPVLPDTAYFALSADSAKEYKANYLKNLKIVFPDTIPIESFTVRSIDLLEAMGVSKRSKVDFDFVRIYLGMDNNDNFRLLLTPVKDADFVKKAGGTDVVLSGFYTTGVANKTAVVYNGEYVLDFNMPCPNTCGDDLLRNR